MHRIIALGVLLASSTALAEPTSGVDAMLFRSSYDTNGIFGVEGARLMPKRDISFKLQLGYAQSPIDAAVPGIGAMAGDTTKESILDYLVTLDMTFAMTLTSKIAFGLDFGGYRTATGVGYGDRGRYESGGRITTPSTGLIALRPLSNIDPSANPDDPAAYLGDGLAGPLDVRAGLKFALYEDPKVAVTFVGTVVLPFGDDYMLLGDSNLVYEPKLAFEWRADRVHATRVVANLGARIRERTVLQGYDTADSAMTTDDAKVFLDVGSEALAAVGAQYEISPRAIIGAEAQSFIPLPTSVGYGKCRLFNGLSCKSLDDADYWGDAKKGDLAVLVAAGLNLRLSAEITADVIASAGPVGARGDDFRITTGLIWSPQPAGVSAPGRNDHDGDGIPDSVDGCPDEAEDKDGFQDEDGCADVDNDDDGTADGNDDCPNEPEDKDGFQDGDGCPERDNDNDGVPDATDRCPNDAEDGDGYQDDDGCPDEDNDGDGLADAKDKCPNDPETVNGFDDDDGCPDVRATTGPEERNDRIDLKGQQVSFDRRGNLTNAAKLTLTQAATIIKNRKLTIRIEVLVARGTKSTSSAALNAQRPKDNALASRRAAAVQEFLISQGVAANQLQAVGIGSDRPLDSAAPTDPSNDRVDLIKAQQGGTP
jgi:outer membrane protein OmpA-like peptidoglycan-associated protein